MNSLKLLLLLTFTPLMACSHSQDSNDNPAYAPVVNPHPQYFMTVKGHIDSHLKGQLDLKWIATYFTTHSQCNYTVNAFEGVVTYRTREINFKVVLDQKGNYQIKIPLDYFEPGRCGWQIQDIAYESSINKNIALSIAGFTNDEKPSADFKDSRSNEIICVTLASCHYNTQEQFGVSLPRKHNYIYELNVLRRGS